MSELTIATWKQFEGEHPGAIADLEKKLWAPWLAASSNSIAGRMDVFPEGQLCIYDEHALHASLSLNRIQWDNQPDSLPSWDDVAGEPTTYENTFVPGGNTLTLMSMNVNPDSQGLKLPARLVGAARHLAAHENIQNIIGSFRPSEYGNAALRAIENQSLIPSFDEYITSTNSDGLPVDAWLRSLARNGMTQLKVDRSAMAVTITSEEFQELQQPDWRDIEHDGQAMIWCGQTGFFYKQTDQSYTYRESNIWGRLD